MEGVKMSRFAYFRAVGDRNGYIFVDALLAMIILVVALAAFLGTYRQATVGTVETRERTVATDLAMQTLENLKKYDWAGRGRTDAVWSSPTAQTVAVNGQTYTIRYGVITALTTTAIASNNNVIPVKVTVSWPTGKSVQMATYYLKQKTN